MKPEVNAMLQKVKQELSEASLEQIRALRLPDPQPKSTTPDFSTMSAIESVRWCLKNGITKAGAIAKLTGKKATAVYTAMWKVKHPKRSKRLNRESNARRKAGITKPTTTKVKKPKIENGLYDDGMETPWRDALQRRGVFPDFVKPRSLEIADEASLMAENRRLKILVEHYESLLFKGAK